MLSKYLEEEKIYDIFHNLIEFLRTDMHLAVFRE